MFNQINFGILKDAYNCYVYITLYVIKTDYIT